MKVLVTGAKGFVGKNLVSTLYSIMNGKDNTRDIVIDAIYEYDITNTKDELDAFVKSSDIVVNLAGVNRPEKIEEFYEGNSNFGELLCSLLKKYGNQAAVINSSSIQVGKDNDYAKSKEEGEKKLVAFGLSHGNKIYNYRFANLFGKWCRPNYNSVTATWCYNVANGVDIVINDETAEITLCYIDDVVNEIIECMKGNANFNGEYYEVEKNFHVTLGELANRIKSFHASRDNLYVVEQDELNCRLYATYLSYLPVDSFSYPLHMNMDERGSFTEFLKTNNYGQVSVNISKPGIVKGNHWHHTKNEKFLVVSGEGIIRFRNIFSDEVIEYKVSGNKLEVIDIPTGYTHNIENVGENDMVTIMWANESFDPTRPDTYFEEV